MIKLITEDEYGAGNWFTVLVGACVYVVMRKANKLLPLTSVCDSVSCDVYELGRMVSRVVEHLDIKLPDFDVVGLFDRLFKEWVKGKGNIGKDLSVRMVKMGIFLLQCMIKWYVTTGRRPVPVVVAVMVFVCEVNEVEISMEDLAGQLNVAVGTCRARYKEILKRLVDVARENLPWGEDVNVKNIMKNAPIVIQFMEVKSKCDHEKEVVSLENVDADLECLVSDCLNREDEGLDDGGVDWEVEDLGRLNVTHECLSAIYSKYLEEYAKMKTKRVDDTMIGSSEKFGFFVDTNEYWSGDSELSKKLFLDRILEKDVGLNAMPPSFVKGCLKTKKIREKIKAAKIRIEKIRRPRLGAESFNESDDRLLTVKSKKRKKVDIDWEDFVIETLLLHDVKEEEIEKGYYNTLLDLHVFQGI